MQPPIQPPIPPPHGPYSPPPPSLKEERNWAMACHLSSLSAFLGVPFGNVIGPLIIWLMKKDQFPLVADQGKEAVNFGILLTIFYLLAGLTAFFLIGIPALCVLPFVHLYFAVVASMRASEGEAYRYPFNFPFVK
jgi:uncharacterized protein